MLTRVRIREGFPEEVTCKLRSESEPLLGWQGKGVGKPLGEGVAEVKAWSEEEDSGLEELGEEGGQRLVGDEAGEGGRESHHGGPF